MAKRLLSSLAMLTIVVLPSACSMHRASRHDFENSRTFAADYDCTWSAVMDASADLVLPVEKVSRDSGFLTLQWMTIPKEWVDCYAQPPGPGKSHAAYLFNVFVRKDSASGTKVTVNSFMSRTDVPSAFSECFSTGAFESLFFGAVEKKLKESRCSVE